MERAERLFFCEKCALRRFSGKNGLVCSLTGEHAKFEGTCPDFTEDVGLTKKAKEQENIQSRRNDSGSYVAWLVLLTIAWFSVGFYAFSSRFLYPGIVLFLIFLVIVKLTHDWRKRNHT